MVGLVKRAVSERETQSGHSIDVAFLGSKPKNLGYTEKLCVYRFLQEGLSNALRHSGDKAVKVEILALQRSSGRAFKTTEKDLPRRRQFELGAVGGQGLLGLKDRAESIGGTLSIESTKGEGATLTLLIPNEGQI